ncbi:pyrroline-5-carboxylate reductase [Fusibacter bizertensis]|uniref:Pyrroline-5-carboxylate reductase n=1 Tax=Fusibacter bizertensis TaxID=1488331 RepID=A0ABT6N8K3_9FIRM|nr:pyrroline-5-carboxylate reductase [Fusibacter bizertensis]MDH8676755.1 pyrroline-5-carboxylate reductase [Fusibacter bizertensis]
MAQTIGFIGGGNMASAIIKGLIQQEIYSPSNIFASALSERSVDRLKNQFAINSSQSNEFIVKNSDIIVLAVKPYLVFKIIDEIKSVLKTEQIVISIASGITLKKLNHAMPEQRVYRAMPNTPASVNMGMTSICTTLNPNETSRTLVAQIFEAIGKTAWIDESLMHAAIAVHGSSPAYAFVMIEAMADAAVLEGMPRDKAYIMAAQSLLGAAQMVLDSGLHPGVLKDQVTSPGGNTIKAIAVLEEDGFRSSIIRAMHAAAEKSREMEANN